MDNKTFCKMCGTSILLSTSEKTGGFCIPCKQAVDVKNQKKYRDEKKSKKRELFRSKYQKKSLLVLWYVLEWFIVFTFIYGAVDHYPRMFAEGDMQIISILSVIVGGFGALFVTGMIIYQTYKLVANDKNT